MFEKADSFKRLRKGGTRAVIKVVCFKQSNKPPHPAYLLNDFCTPSLPTKKKIGLQRRRPLPPAAVCVELQPSHFRDSSKEYRYHVTTRPTV